MLDASTSVPKWQAVTEIEPHQLYALAEMENEVRRIPIGIYKIEGDRLILRRVQTFQRTVGGLPFGEPRYEMPTDFSGVVEVLSRQ